MDVGDDFHGVNGLSLLPEVAAVNVLRAGSLERVPWLRHGFSTRAGGVSGVYGCGGDLNLGSTAVDDAGSVRENRRRFVKATLGQGEGWPLVTLRQTHSSEVRSVCSSEESGQEGDALVTARSSLLLGMMTADCVPILLVDTRRRVVAAVHAGWRGTASGICGKTVQAMRDEFGCDPGDLLGAIGPSIGPCCYQVGREVREAFGEDGELFQGDRLDLWEANRRQLVGAGLSAAGVETLGECTACAREEDGARRFFSHRAEHGRTGRMMAVIGIAADAAGGDRVA